MNPMVLKILFFTCIPIGIFLLVVGIKRVYRVFNTATLAEIRMSEESVDFEIAEAGRYSVWAKAPAFKYNHLDRIRPAIYNRDNRQKIELIHNFLGAKSNNGSTGELKLFSFRAEAGKYTMKPAEGSSLLIPLQGRTAPMLKEADLSDCLFLVRKNTPPLYGLSGVLSIVLGVGASIAGFVLGLLTEKIWG